MTTGILQPLLLTGAGTILGLLLATLWRKNPIDTAYMTESACQKCRSECAAHRQADRQELREEIRSLGRSVDDLRKTIIDLIREK